MTWKDITNPILKDLFTENEFNDLSTAVQNIFLTAKDVEEDGDYPFNYTIDGKQFAIYNNYSAEQLMNDYYGELFEDNIYEVPRHWRQYIDREAWISDQEYNFKGWFYEVYGEYKDLDPDNDDFYIFTTEDNEI